MSKECTKCKQTLPLTNFHKTSNHGRPGLKAQCKSCRKLGDRRYREVEPNEQGSFPAVPPGFHVKGISTLTDEKGGIKGQWVKTFQSPEDRTEKLLEAVRELADEWPKRPKTAGPKTTKEDLLAVYPMGDPHLGMFSWALETGVNFDLKVAESDLYDAVDKLVGLAAPAEKALIINLGDFFHTDNTTNRTNRSGNALDVDSRWAKVLGVGLRVMRRAIDRALEKHQHVTVINEIGNHDEHTSVMLGLALQQYYEDEPRVSIDTSPNKFHWYRFEKNLIGVTHGDTVKLDNLPGIMAVDRQKDWGEADYKFWYTGHVHHDSAKEISGCLIETFRTLAPRDAWHNGQGYRSGRDMKCDILHKDYGRICRHIVGIPQIYSERKKKK
jgi:hypothetical protein